jgi:hypothetical protein
MRKICFTFVLFLLIGSQAYAGLSLGNLTAEKLKNTCSEDKTQTGFLVCIVYLAGWWDGVEAQWYHTYFLRLISNNGPTPPWAKTLAHQCRKPETSDEELAEKYVAWYNSKISILRASDIESFKRVRAGDAIRTMMKEVYFCKLGKNK